MNTQPALYQPGGKAGIHIFDASALPWRSAGRDGIAHKAIRFDDERGHYLGLVGFEPMTRSGLHQHRGVATSFFVDGGLSDYSGSAGLHQVGINLAGATHDAIAYQRSLLVARLEGPVVYPPEEGALHGLHAGARTETFVNPAPETPPDNNIDIDRRPMVATAVPGLCRQMIFDYTGVGDDRRMVQWWLQPETECSPWRASALVEFWVRGGAVAVNGRVAHANCFVVVEPEAEVTLAAPFGALLLGWAEGPVAWSDGCDRHDPFGF